MISKKQNKETTMHFRLRPLLILTTLLSFVSLIDSISRDNQAGVEQQHSKSNGSCPKAWILLNNNKCYRIIQSQRSHIAAKAKCSDLGAQLAIIDDDDTERESNDALDNIIAYLNSPEKNKSETTKNYYVTLSDRLMDQFQQNTKDGYHWSGSRFETAEESNQTISSLWLSKEELRPFNFTNEATEQHNLTAFALVHSKDINSYGIAPVYPTRKMYFICERNPGNSNPNQSNSSTQNQHSSSNEPRSRSSNNDLSTNSDQQPSSTSANFVDLVKEAHSIGTTPAPEPPSVLFREYPQDQMIILGTTVEMRCSRLDSDSNLFWTFNNKNLTQAGRIRISKSGTLRIEHVRNSDDGNYTCTIQSGTISESKVAKLEIVSRPHQPEYITAELLDKLSTSVRVKWQPGFNGNSPIQKYLLEMLTVGSNYEQTDMAALIQSEKWELAKANISADHTSVIIPDLKPAKKYVFRIKATNRVGTGEPSYPTRPAIEIPVQPPSMPPENITATPKSATSITVHWSPPPVDSQNGIIKGYKIRHKLAGYASDSDWYPSDVSETTSNNLLAYTLDDLIVWQKYEIQVAAENDKGAGPFSSSIFMRTKEGKPDKGPRSVSAEAISPTAIKINWTPPPPQDINGVNQGYKVQAWYDIHQTKLAKELVVPHNTASPFHSTAIDGLEPYTEYYIGVRCFTNAGDGPSNEDMVKVKTKQDLPEAVPVLEFADVLDKSLRLLWKAPNRINGELDHYTLEYSELSLPDRRIVKQYSSTTSEAKILDLMPQTTYIFKIYPHTNVGQGPVKVNQTTTSVPPVLPEPPSNLVYSKVGAHSVELNFNPGFDGNANIDKWQVEAQMISLNSKNEYNFNRWQHIYTSTNHSHGANFIVVRNLRPFTKYRLRLVPINTVGPSRYPSEPSAEFQTAQIEPEQPPRDLAIDSINSTSLIVHWSPLANSLWSGNPRGYNLTWHETSNPLGSVAYHLINDTRQDFYQVTKLEEFTEYSFTIYACNEAGSSPASEAAIAITAEDVPSAGPANITASAKSSNAISVDWTPVPKRHRNGIIRGYEIQYQAIKDHAPLQHKTIEDNSTRHVTLNDLKPYTVYQLAIAAYTSVGDGTFSNVISVQTLEDTPGQPQNLSFPTVSQTSARVLWDPPVDTNGDIIGYKVSYHLLPKENDAAGSASKEVYSQELQQNERTYKATNLKPNTHYIFTVTAKTKEGWGQQANTLLYTFDSELRANLPFFKESWFVILCACSSIVITIIITALLFIQTKSYKYKQNAIKSASSHDRLGDAGFTIDIDDNGSNGRGAHYNNGFGLLSQQYGSVNHRRTSNGTLNKSAANNFTLPKSPPRPDIGRVNYNSDDVGDEGDDDVFENNVIDIVGCSSTAGKTSSSSSHHYHIDQNNQDSSDGDSIIEKPVENGSSNTAPDSESPDAGPTQEEYVNVFNLNGGRIVVDNMAGSRAPLPGFTSLNFPN